MSKKIDNKLLFNIYIWTDSIMSILPLGFMAFFIYVASMSDKHAYHQYHVSLYFYAFILYFIIKSFFKPSYLEAEIYGEQIRLKAIDPNKYFRFGFFLLLFPKKYTSEFVIDRSSFTSYRITISRWGTNKNIVLQKTLNGKIYESKPINLNYLGYKKYTDLILAIDRLSQKISLN